MVRIVPLLAGLALLFGASAAQAGEGPPLPDRTFEFSGTGCTADCESGATAFLTLQSYELGSEFGTGDVLDFGFQSDSGVFSGFQLDSITFAHGSLNGTPDEVANVLVNGTAFVDGAAPTVGEGGGVLINFSFESTIDGFDDQSGNFWEMLAFPVVFGETVQDDAGTVGIWNQTSVPEPGMLALFGAGLIGLGVARRRRRVAV